jgi:hypothetical protein
MSTNCCKHNLECPGVFRHVPNDIISRLRTSCCLPECTNVLWNDHRYTQDILESHGTWFQNVLMCSGRILSTSWSILVSSGMFQVTFLDTPRASCCLPECPDVLWKDHKYTLKCPGVSRDVPVAFISIPRTSWSLTEWFQVPSRMS